MSYRVASTVILRICPPKLRNYECHNETLKENAGRRYQKTKHNITTFIT